MNADPCGSGSTALLKTGFFKIVKKMCLPEPAACVEAGACQDWTGSTKLRPCSIHITVGRLTVSSTGMILYCEEMFYEKFD